MPDTLNPPDAVCTPADRGISRSTLLLGARSALPLAVGVFAYGLVFGVLARQAGSVCARAKTTDVIDATVVVGAAARGDVVVTSDPMDLRHLARSNGLALELHRV